MPAGFLDLSAELRNQVYYEALTHDRENDQIATVALLRACHQIHSEALGILHAQSAFLISVLLVKGEYRISNIVGTDSLLEFGGDCLDLPSYCTTTSERVLRALPSEMLKVSKIKVQIQIPEQSPRDRTQILNPPIRRFIAALWRHLNSHQQDRHLEITTVNNERYAGKASAAIDDFMGLASLGSHVHLTLHLFDEKVVDYVQSLRKATLATLRDTITDMS